MTLLLRALLSAGLAACAAAAPAPRATVALVVDGAERLRVPVLERLSRELNGRAAVTVYVLNGGEIADPIEKGRVLAALAKRSLVVAIGDEATGFVTAEVEDVPVFFVGAGSVPGDSLRSRWVSGIFSFSVDDLLNAARALRLSDMGVLYTPGYETVVEWIRAGAAARGMTLRERRVDSLRALAPAVRALLNDAGSLWVVGDPLLVRGVGFEFVREHALSGRVPMIAPGSRNLRAGAFMDYEPEPAALAESAAAHLNAALARTARLAPAPAKGGILYNAALAHEWGLAAPRDWRGVH